MDARKLANASRRKRRTEKRLKRVRSDLSGAVQALTAAQLDLEKASARKMGRVRSLNNQILDAQTRLKALKAIAHAVANISPASNVGPRIALAELADRVTGGELNSVFLQISDSEEAEQFDSDEFSSAEEEAADVEASASAIVANDAEADSIDAENEMQEVEAAETALVAESADMESAEAEAPNTEAAAQHRMMQVLQTLAASTPGDESSQTLLELVRSLIRSGRDGLKERMIQRSAVLKSIHIETAGHRKIIIRHRMRINRLRSRIHRMERKSRRFSRQIRTLKANAKENRKQTRQYEKLAAQLRTNWDAQVLAYEKARTRRHAHMQALRRLKRRVATLTPALQLPANALGSDQYRWEAQPWAKCSSECTEVTFGRDSTKPNFKRSVTTRSLKCFNFAHESVDRSYCADKPKPRRVKNCRFNPCPKNCVVGAWQFPKACSNSCGPGVRIGRRSILQPARYGGSCPQSQGARGGMIQSKPCFTVSGCTSVPAKKRAFKELRERAAEQRRTGTVPPPNPRNPGPTAADDTTNVWSKFLKKFGVKSGKADKQRKLSPKAKKAKRARIAAARAKADAAAKRAVAFARAHPNDIVAQARAKQAKRRAKNLRCGTCPKGKAGIKCRFTNCLNKQQKTACKACAKGAGGKACRMEKCHGPAAARQKAVKSAIKSKRNARIAAAHNKIAKAKRRAALRRATQLFDACVSACPKKSRHPRKHKRCRRACDRQRRIRHNKRVLKRRAEKRRAAAAKAKAAAAAGAVAPVSPIRSERRARNIRCISKVCTTFDGSKAGRKCRFHNCLSVKQQAACKSCPRNKRGEKKRKCRRAQCSNPSRRRQDKIRRALAAKQAKAAAASGSPLSAAERKAMRRARNLRCVSKKCTTYDGRRAGRHCRYRNCLSKAQRAVCAACPRRKDGQKTKKCRRAKCSNPARARQAAITKALNAKFAGKCQSKCGTGKKRSDKRCRRQCRARAIKQIKAAAAGSLNGPTTAQKDLASKLERREALRKRRAALIRARNMRCISKKCSTFDGQKPGRKCRYDHCLNAAEQAVCKACPRDPATGKKLESCRLEKCSNVAKARQAKIRARRNSRCLSTVCTAYNGKPEGRKCRFHNCLSHKQQKACKSCPRNKRGEKKRKCRRAQCSNPARARQAKLTAKGVIPAPAKKAVAPVTAAPAALTLEQRRARNMRCISHPCRAFNGKKEGRKCRFADCLNAEQKAACKACPRDASGKKDVACRKAKCSQPAKDRQALIRARRNARCVSAVCKAYNGKPEGRKCRFHNCLSRKQQKACKSCPRNKRGEKKRKCRRAQCSNPARARQTALTAKGVAPAPAKAVVPATTAAPAALTVAQRRARNMRCISHPCRAFNGKKEGRKCRFADCLNAEQKAACKACPRDASGKKDKACRKAKCSQPAKDRQALIRARRNARCVTSVCTTYNGKPEGRKCRFHNCLSRKQQKACKSCPRNKRGQKKRKCRIAQCSNPARARQAALTAKGVAPAPAKPAAPVATPAFPAAAAPATPVPPTTPASPAAPVRKARKVFWYKPEGLRSDEDRRILRWADSVPDTNADGSSRRRAGALVPVGGRMNDGPNLSRRNYSKFLHHGMQSAKSFRLGNKFDVFAVLKFTGDPTRPANRWGAATAFMLNAPGLTPVDPTQHAETLGGVGVAVSEGQLRIVAEGRAWGVGGATIKGDETYIVRLRRTSANVFELFVGESAQPQAILHSDAIEGPDARLKLGVSDALWYGWEGLIKEVVGFRGNLSKERIAAVYRRLADDHHL